MSEKASHGRLLKPDKLQNERRKRKRKSEEKESRRREKSNGCTLSFYISYFGDFWPKKLLDAKDPFGDNVFKNPARCTRSLIGYSSCDDTTPFCGSTQTLVPNKHHVWTAPKSLET